MDPAAVAEWERKYGPPKKVKPPRSSSMAIPGLVLLLVFLGLAWYGMSTNESGDEETGELSWAERDRPAYLLAVIDDGDTGRNDPKIETYATLLDSVMTKCRTPDREAIADTVSAATEVAGDRGQEITQLQMLRSMDEAVPKGAEMTQTCREVATALVVLMTS